MENAMQSLDREPTMSEPMKTKSDRQLRIWGELVKRPWKRLKNLVSKPDHILDGLRLNSPWPELKRFVETIDLNTPDPIPYVVILVKIAEEWAQTHSGNLPSTREEKKEFKDLVKSKMVSMDEENYKEAIEAAFKVFAPRGISNDIREIINDSRAEVSSDSSDLWIMVLAALKEFISNEGDGEVPLEGSIPDMTSSTEHYVNLQNIYHTKAEADCLSMEQRVKNILIKIGRDPSSISKPTIKSFCKNARKLKVSELAREDYIGKIHPDVAARTLPVPTNSTDSSRDATYNPGDSPKYPPTSLAPYVPSSLPTPRGPYIYDAAGTCLTCKATTIHHEWCPYQHVPYPPLPTRQLPQCLLCRQVGHIASLCPSGRFCTQCGAHRRYWQMGPGK